LSGLDKNRLRNKTVSFRVSSDEARQLEARIKVCGMPKGEYFIQSLLHNNISIVVGKYQSDRLSLELRRLREAMLNFDISGHEEQLIPLLDNCKALLCELQSLTAKNNNDNELNILDFGTVK
jgi:hypothetical protein